MKSLGLFKELTLQSELAKIKINHIFFLIGMSNWKQKNRIWRPESEEYNFKMKEKKKQKKMKKGCVIISGQES